jgi:hypothetical protein
LLEPHRETGEDIGISSNEDKTDSNRRRVSPLRALEWLQGGKGISKEEGERLRKEIEAERLARHRKLWG